MIGRCSSILRLVSFTVLFFLAISAFGLDSTDQIRAEIDRLQQSLKAKPIKNPDFPEMNRRIESILGEAKEVLSGGMPYAALEKLGQVENLLQGARVATDKAEAVKSGLPAFEAEWNKANLQLTAEDKDARKRQWSKSPVVLRAIAESAQTKAIPLLEGSRGFAVSTKPEDGLFYMGQAQGEAAFAAFVASLKWENKLAAIPLRSFLPELARLQEKTNTAFQPPRSIEQHPRFIALNSTIKLAEEADAGRFYAGALYQYLEAVRHYGMLDAKLPDNSQKEKLKQAVAAKLKEIRSSKQDDSLAQLFAERAQLYVAHPDGSATTDDEWRAAQVILYQVLPAYYAALKPSAPVRSTSARTVTLTLVRWPYT
jgi:hypothetical protein